MEKYILRNNTLKKAFEKACCSESLGGNAGPNRLALNTIIDKEGKIYGFSNNPSDYQGFYQATLIVNYTDFFQAFRSRIKKGCLYEKLADFFSPLEKKKYIEEILFLEARLLHTDYDKQALLEAGANLENVKKSIARQLKGAGIRVKLEEQLPNQENGTLFNKLRTIPKIKSR